MPELGAARELRCGIAVVGAGPAGIAAAAVAAELGSDVVLLDAGLRPGGQIWRHRERAELPTRARRWLDRLDESGARFLPGSSVVDARHMAGRAADAPPVDARHAEGPRVAAPPVAPQHADEARMAASHLPGGLELLVEQGTEALVVRAERLILATGARELFLPFPGWTLPNIFGVGGAQALLKAGTSFEGKRVVIAGSGPLLLAVGASLRERGARVAVIAEQAPGRALFRFAAGLWRSPGRLVQAARLRASLGSVRYLAGCWVSAARGDEVVREVTLTDGRRSWSEECDILCVGHGLVPNTELAELLGCATEGGRVRVDETQRTTVEGVYCAGEPTGIAGVDAALLEGEIAARAASRRGAGGRATRGRGENGRGDGEHGARGHGTGERVAVPRALVARRRREHHFAGRLARAFTLRAELRSPPPPGTLICRCEDVTSDALDPSWSFRQAKLYTRIGMGPCQARVCGPACGVYFDSGSNACRIPALPTKVSTLIAISPGEEP